jgi:secreted trypsin-like serine protease
MRTLAILALTMLAACAAPSGEDAAASDGALVGGAEVTPDAFPSTVYLEHGCTAVKVAPKLLLTAAHCLLASSGAEVYPAGALVGIAREPAKGFTSVRVAAVHVEPHWRAGCDAEYCGGAGVVEHLDAPDVGVLELADDLADVPATSIDDRALAPGDRVVVLGFGCTQGARVRARETPVLRFAETTIVETKTALHEGSPIDGEDLPRVAGIYALTGGPGLDPKNPGLCPGDSGGPLYVKTTRGLRVVGVNANYTFRPDDQDRAGLAVTNWHTRLDAGSRQDVAAWLASVGVSARTSTSPRP